MSWKVIEGFASFVLVVMGAVLASNPPGPGSEAACYWIAAFVVGGIVVFVALWLGDRETAASERRLEDRLDEMAKQLAILVKGSVGGPTTPPVVGGTSLTEADVASGLRRLGHPVGDVLKYTRDALALLRQFGITTSEAWGQLLADEWVQRSLEDAYQRDLGRSPEGREGPLVDPVGLASWGARLFLTPAVDRASALDDIRRALRNARARGAV